MHITAQQIQDVLNRLPQTNQVDDEYYRVAVKEYTQVTPHTGQMPCCNETRFLNL